MALAWKRCWSPVPVEGWTRVGEEERWQRTWLHLPPPSCLAQGGWLCPRLCFSVSIHFCMYGWHCHFLNLCGNQGSSPYSGPRCWSHPTGSPHVSVPPRWLSVPTERPGSALGTLCFFLLPFFRNGLIFKYDLSQKWCNFYIAVW